MADELKLDLERQIAAIYERTEQQINRAEMVNEDQRSYQIEQKAKFEA